MNYSGYVNTKKLNLDTKTIKKNCLVLMEYVLNNFLGDYDSKYDYMGSGQNMMTTKLFTRYNLFLYPLPQFHELFFEIKKYFYEIYPNNKQNYYIQSWLNVYKKGQNIDWHSHWDSEKQSYHGFYCVNIPEKSSTLYQLRDSDDIIQIPSEENLLVLSPSDGDIHKSTEGSSIDEPRITIAFDILPEKHIPVFGVPNHWIPF